MLSWVTPFPGNPVITNLVPKPAGGANVFVFCYNVEKCCTVQGANCTPPRKNTRGGNTSCISRYFNINALQRLRAEEFSAGGVQYQTMST